MATGQNEATLKVAVIGAGPSGFYASEALLRAGCKVAVDLFEKLPVPFGLVRYGVAPDHPQLKSVTRVFERIASTPGFRFMGNINVGRDIAIDELSECYHAIIFATGAEHEKSLGIPGEDLPGSHSARAFVAWYNGHPDYRDHTFDFNHECAVIVGQGNVALDIARILAKSPDELRTTDIASHALEQLAESRIQDIRVVGRRGPVQTKFTAKELREFESLVECSVSVSPGELKLNDSSQRELDDLTCPQLQLNMNAFHALMNGPSRSLAKRCQFQFFLEPRAILGRACVNGIEFERTRLEGSPFRQQACGTGKIIRVDCGLVIRSIGYRTTRLASTLEGRNLEPCTSTDGRVIENGKRVPGLYVAGWAKRGAEGTIGSNRGDSVATVDSLLADRAHLSSPRRDIEEFLGRVVASQKVVVDFADWKRVDDAEISRGQLLGKPREKFTRVTEMLSAVSTKSPR